MPRTLYSKAFAHGFISKCAEYSIDPRALIKYAYGGEGLTPEQISMFQDWWTSAANASEANPMEAFNAAHGADVQRFLEENSNLYKNFSKYQPGMDPQRFANGAGRNEFIRWMNKTMSAPGGAPPPPSAGVPPPNAAAAPKPPANPAAAPKPPPNPSAAPKPPPPPKPPTSTTYGATPQKGPGIGTTLKNTTWGQRAGILGAGVGGWNLGRQFGENISWGGKTLDQHMQEWMGGPKKQVSPQAAQQGLQVKNTGQLVGTAAGAASGIAAASAVPAVAAAGSVAGTGALGWGLGRVAGRNISWGGKTLDKHTQGFFENMMQQPESDQSRTIRVNRDIARFNSEVRQQREAQQQKEMAWRAQREQQQAMARAEEEEWNAKREERIAALRAQMRAQEA